MPRVGSCELYTSADGWVEIDLYDASDFSFAPIELRTSSEDWGVPYLRDPNSADTPIEVFTQANGWQGINRTGWIYVEDFETGDLSRWYASTDPNTAVTTQAATIGEYGVELADEQNQSTYAQRIYSHPNEGMTSLPYYPQVGDEFEFFIRWPGGAADSGHHRLAFGVEDQNVSQHFGPISDDFSNDFDNWLAINIQTSIDEIHIWKRIDGNRTQRDLETFNPGSGQTFRVVVDWCSTTNDQLSADVYEYNPSGSDTHIVTVSDTHSDYTTTRRGVFLESEIADEPTHYDALRKYPPA